MTARLSQTLSTEVRGKSLGSVTFRQLQNSSHFYEFSAADRSELYSQLDLCVRLMGVMCSPCTEHAPQPVKGILHWKPSVSEGTPNLARNPPQ